MSQKIKNIVTMKFKVLFLLAILLTSFSLSAQRGVRLGYIDTEYILENVPEYKQANALLDKKVTQWKSEVEKRLAEIDLKKKELENEKILLTKELYDERFEDLSFDEAEIIDYQQKRFGPNGDLMIQKRQLIEPIQDQIFAAVQEIAELKKFDFIFDKSADVVMLYAAERYDISEQVLRTITRTSKRAQAKNKKERKALEAEAVVPEVDKAKDAREKALDDKRAAAEKKAEDRRLQRIEAAKKRKEEQDAARAAKRKETAERRQKALDAKKNKAQPAKTSGDSTETNATTSKTAAEILEEKRLQKVKEREARKKALDDRKKKALEAKRKAREAQLKKRDSIAKAKKEKNN